MAVKKNTKLLDALALKPLESPPIWLLRQAGRYMPSYMAVRNKAGSFMNLCKNPEYVSEVTLQPIDQFDLDAAIIFSDILTIPDAMGINLNFHEGKGPIIHNPIRNIKDLQKVSSDIISDLSYVSEAIQLTKKALNNRVPLIGFSGAPWTLACYIVEGHLTKNLQVIKALTHTDSYFIERLLNYLENCVIDYCKMQVAAGVDVIMLFDSWGGMLPYNDYIELSYKSIERILNSINIPTIVFSKPCSPWLESFKKLNCNGVGIDYTCDILSAKQVLSGHKAIQGNLDPNLLLGSKHKLDLAIESTLKTMQDIPGFIFNLGHGIVKETKPEMVKYLVEKVRACSKGINHDRNK